MSLAPCPGIRPGGALILRFTPLEMVYCTMAFIVTDGSDLFVATAGHCVDSELGVPGVGERVSAHGVPGTFGTVAYQWCEGGDSLGQGCGVGTDFALIRIDGDKHAFVSPEMCAWGAPSGGVFTGTYFVGGGPPLVAQHFGWGMGVAAADVGWNWGGVSAQPANPVTQPRTEVLVEADETVALMEGPAFSGDSGSGVMVLDPLGGEPRALGVLTHVSNAGNFVQRLDHALAKAGAETGRTFTLVTSL